MSLYAEILFSLNVTHFTGASFVSRFNITRGGGGEDSSDEGLTPITLASRTQDDAMIKMLLKAGAKLMVS